jgi:hypothetical protein
MPPVSPRTPYHHSLSDRQLDLSRARRRSRSPRDGGAGLLSPLGSMTASGMGVRDADRDKRGASATALPVLVPASPKDLSSVALRSFCDALQADLAHLSAVSQGAALLSCASL